MSAENQLMQNLERATEAVQDPILRRNAWRLLQEMDKITTEVLPVGQTRNELPKVRSRLYEGGAALVAERGIIRNPQETTVMISLATLQQLIISIIDRSSQMQVGRTLPSEVLTGLSPVPGAAKFEIDFDEAAKGHHDQDMVDVEF
jgi:hypothetical protein